VSPRILRAEVLMAQSRYDLAEQELGHALAESPDDPLAHAMLSVCHHVRDKHAEAVAAARRAISLDPGMPYAHFALALARAGERRWADAEAAVRYALGLDPTDPDYHQLLAEIRFNREDWAGALAAADQGLTFDAQHAGCLNSRAMALTRLGRADEAARTVDGVLADNPEDAYSHATRGWTALHQSDAGKALEHFREALRLNPELDPAREGMVLALKARYRVYRVLLQFFLWMSMRGRRFQWGIIIGIFVSQRVAVTVARDSPELAPVAWPVFYALLAFGLLTWLADPLFNLLLRFNRYGRHAVPPDARACALWVGAFVGVALVAFVYSRATGLVLPDMVAIGSVLMAVVVSAVYRFAAGWRRWTAAGFAVLLAGINAAAIFNFYTGYIFANQADDAAEVILRTADPKTGPEAGGPARPTRIEQYRYQTAVDGMHRHLGYAKDLVQVFCFGLLGLTIVSQIASGRR
jgi:tetratricopeptide (TPR) repeat protein